MLHCILYSSGPASFPASLSSPPISPEESRDYRGKSPQPALLQGLLAQVSSPGLCSKLNHLPGPMTCFLRQSLLLTWTLPSGPAVPKGPPFSITTMPAIFTSILETHPDPHARQGAHFPDSIFPSFVHLLPCQPAFVLA